MPGWDRFELTSTNRSKPVEEHTRWTKVEWVRPESGLRLRGATRLCGRNQPPGMGTNGSAVHRSKHEAVQEQDDVQVRYDMSGKGPSDSTGSRRREKQRRGWRVGET